MLPLFGACLFIILFSTEIIRKNSFVFYVFAFLSILYISKFIALPIFLVDNVANLIGPNEIRSVRISHVGLLFSLIPTILLFYGVLRNPYRYEVRKTKLPVPNLPSELDQTCLFLPETWLIIRLMKLILSLRSYRQFRQILGSSQS